MLASEPDAEAERLREVWALAGNTPSADFPDPAAIASVWQNLDAFTAQHQAEQHAASEPRRAVRRVGLLRPWMAIAASVLVAATIGVWALWLRPIVEVAAPGERLSVTLPDGSQIELNSGATVRYARRFEEERVVHLDGEAFFDVVHADKPFAVHTFNATVRVLGTRFNVRAWSQSLEAATTVALEEGRVALSAASSPEHVVTLVPGQIHRIGAETQAATLPDSTGMVDALAWRQGDLVFKDQRLGVILEDVERRFGIDMAMQPATLRQRRLSLGLRAPGDAEAVIRDICVALSLNYRQTATGWEIYSE